MPGKLGRAAYFNDVPLDAEIDRIYSFLRLMAQGRDPRNIGNLGDPRVKSSPQDYFNGRVPMSGIKIGEDPDSSHISSYMAIAASDASRTVGANSNLYYTVADADFPILGEIELGTTVTLYRDPWDQNLQLTYSIVSGDLKVRLTNDTGAGITVAAGEWYVTLINHL